jgi:hypothetical protein
MPHSREGEYPRRERRLSLSPEVARRGKGRNRCNQVRDAVVINFTRSSQSRASRNKIAVAAMPDKPVRYNEGSVRY